jgi:uncharacterized spore protein YtfJ
MENPLREIFGQITDKLHGTATVRTVFGEPVQANGKTIVPVAKVGYGFGAGADDAKGGFSGGGGGGVGIKPVGVIEVTDKGTRFIGIHERSKLLAVLGLGLLLGFAAGHCRRSKID